MNEKMRSFVKGLIMGQFGSPLPMAEKEPVAYLYNGVRLPALPEWDRETYPYAVIVYFPSDKNCKLCVFGEKGYYNPAYDSPGTAVWEVIQFQNAITRITYYDYYDKDPPYFKLKSTSDSDIVSLVQTPGREYLLWSNYDIPNEDGSLYFAASDPIPVYE